jgi:hypothetical protein
VFAGAVMEEWFTKYFLQGWPVMWANPGVTISLLIVGGAIGWGLKHIIGKERIATLTEKVEIADRHRSHAENRLLEMSAQHKAVLRELSHAGVELRRLAVQSPTSELSSPNDNAVRWSAFLRQNPLRRNPKTD